MIDAKLLAAARGNLGRLRKVAFNPMTPEAQAAMQQPPPPAPPPGPAMDPAMMGMPPMGAPPPMDPAMMGAPPPMDPAMMGAPPPMDPAAMGMPPPGMDPAMMGGMPPPPMDPAMMGVPPPPPAEGGMPIMMTLDDLKAILKEVKGDSGSGEGDKPKLENTEKKPTDEVMGKLNEISAALNSFVTMMGSAGAPMPPDQVGAGAPPPPPEGMPGSAPADLNAMIPPAMKQAAANRSLHSLVMKMRRA